MSSQVKISIDLQEVNRRTTRANGQTCLKHCPKLMQRSENGVTFRQLRFCPLKAVRLMDDTSVCDYGRRLIASEAVRKSIEKKAKKSVKGVKHGRSRS